MKPHVILNSAMTLDGKIATRTGSSEMARMMGLTQPAASQHLKILKTARILDSTKQGNHIYYTFNEDALIHHKEKIDFLFGCLFIKCHKIDEKPRGNNRLIIQSKK